MTIAQCWVLAVIAVNLMEFFCADIFCTFLVRTCRLPVAAIPFGIWWSLQSRTNVPGFPRARVPTQTPSPPGRRGPPRPPEGRQAAGLPRGPLPPPAVPPAGRRAAPAEGGVGGRGRAVTWAGGFPLKNLAKKLNHSGAIFGYFPAYLQVRARSSLATGQTSSTFDDTWR